MILDSHSHLPPDSKAMEAFLVAEKKGTGYANIFKFIPDSSTVESVIRDMDESAVTKSVVAAVECKSKFAYRIPNELVARAVNKYPDRLIGYASVDPNKGTAAVRELERAVKDLGMRGLKLLPHLVELSPNDSAMYPLYDKAHELGIPVLFHSGTQFHDGTRLKYCKPIYIDDVAVDFPDLKIIIAHFGWPWYEETIAICERHRNVYFDIAGWAPKYVPQIVVRYMNSRLSDKVLFGSDYPLLPRKRILSELEELSLRQESKEKILYKNAARLLKIE